MSMIGYLTARKRGREMQAFSMINFAGYNICLLYTSYLPEVMSLADRLMVISEGKQMATIDRSEFMVGGRLDEERILRLASGMV